MADPIDLAIDAEHRQQEAAFDARMVEQALEPHVGRLPNSLQMSMAISLKRIADRLDDIASGAATINTDTRNHY